MPIQEEDALGKAYDSRLMKRLLGYLRPYKWQVGFALGTIVLKAAADIAGPLITLYAIDHYLSPAGTHSFLDRWISQQPLTGIAELGGLYVFLLCFSFFLEFAQTYYMQWMGQKVMFDLRSQIFRHLQFMHVAFYDKNPVGRLVTRVTSDVDALNELFTAGVVSIVEDVFVLAFIVAILLNIDWSLALLTIAALPLIFIATTFFRKAVRDSYRRIRIAIARINAYLAEHVSGMAVLQLFNREKKAYERFEKINESHMQAWQDAIMAYALYYPVVEILSWAAIAAVIWFGGGQVLRHAAVFTLTVNRDLHAIHLHPASTVVTIGVLVAFMQYAQRFFRPIQDLSDKYNILQGAMAASERIFKLLDTPSEITSPTSPKRAVGPGRIEFEHVWFAYRTVSFEENGKATGENNPQSDGKSADSPRPGEPDWVLRDVSFTIEPGETVAIVGHTGAGKTTLTSLLLRFYDVQRGSIRIDGVDVRDMELSDLRRRFGVVLQDPFLFTATIERNIRLGSEGISRERVERAAEEVNAAEFIQAQEQGFDQPMQERGATLSTGQKQLINFARALAHDPKILVLDEATSSVDTETELRVRTALSRMIGVEGRTSIVIAHRLSTIQRADKILVMHKGKLREMGTHQQLLAQRGIYWKLYQLQYKDQEVSSPPPAFANNLVPAQD